jgi:hypothetical protein
MKAMLLKQVRVRVNVRFIVKVTVKIRVRIRFSVRFRAVKKSILITTFKQKSFFKM